MTYDKSYEIAFEEANQEGKGDTMDPIVEKIERRGMIIGAVNILFDMNVPSNEIENRIMSKYDLDRETADNYIKECTKV